MWQTPKKVVWGFPGTPANWMTGEIRSFGNAEDWEKSLYVTQNLDALGTPEDSGSCEIREVGRSGAYERFGSFERFEGIGKSGDWGKSLYLAEVRTAGRANTWGANELGNWEIGGFRRLEGFGDWGIWENREIREIRKSGIFGREGISGEWEIK